MKSFIARAKAVISRTQNHRGKLWGALAALVLTVVVISCSTVTRTVVVPPQIPGATFAGSETCSECHANVTKDFHTSTHAKLMAKGPNAVNMGCESCHGPGSVHNQNPSRNNIVNPHKSPEVCFQCHLDKRGEFGLPYHHPVVEGKMSCSDCHLPHKGPAIRGGGTALISENETCFQCHTVQRGPFVYEHEASREGCLICHKPHGSINQRMLTERNANLCLKCHFQQQAAAGQILIGGQDHSTRAMRGSCWTAGCHEAVHGSHVNSSLRF